MLKKKQKEKNSRRKKFRREFAVNKGALISFYVVIFFLLIAVLAPLIANNKPYFYQTAEKTYFPLFKDYPELRNLDLRKEKYQGFKIFPPIAYSYSEYNFEDILLPPSSKHLFGTDDQGRDLAARMVHGTRISIFIGLIAVLLYVVIGIILGALAGYYGGWLDVLISRLIEVIMCFPSFFLILTLMAVIDQREFAKLLHVSADKVNLIIVMLVIGLTSWPGIARIVRGEFLKLRESDYILAERSMGANDFRIIFKHIIPNSFAPVLVSATFGIASTILTESSLSFLGFGVQPPTPSWGQILSTSRQYMDFAWWLTFIPGIAIFISITAYNLIGEGIQNALDPKEKKRK